MADKNDPKDPQEENLPVPANAGGQLATVVDGYMALDCSADELEEYAEVFRENTEGETLTERDLPRVMVPAQGMKVWSIPSSEGEKYEEFIRGILVKVTTPRAMWPASMDEGGSAPPICSSPDGIRGVGKPGGDCLTCPFNAWDSAPNGAGKACKEKRMLYMLRKESIIPLVVQAPSTSIQNVKEYRMGLAGQKLPYFGVETELTIERIEGKFPYGRIVLRNAGALTKEQQTTIRGYTKAFGPIFQQKVELTADEESVANTKSNGNFNGEVIDSQVGPDETVDFNGGSDGGSDGGSEGGFDGGNGGQAGNDQE